MAQESASDLMFVDDFYFSLFFDEEADEILSVSDAKYAEGLQFQEALMGDIITSQMANTGTSSSSPTIQALISPPTPNPEAGESSSSSTSSFCDICVERKDSHQMLRNESSCLHSFCSDCIGKHVSTKIQLGITIVSCPGLECRGVLKLDDCRPMLPKDVMERWDEELCRALIASEMKFYCPFKDCSGVLVNDKEEGEVMIRESECPFCHRLFCAQCCVPWHPGIECEEFQIINENERETEDLMLRELAREKKWKRCPNCKFYVERTQGCLHIICRCASEFCYGCGASWTTDHDGDCVRD